MVVTFIYNYLHTYSTSYVGEFCIQNSFNIFTFYPYLATFMSNDDLFGINSYKSVGITLLQHLHQIL